MGNRSKKGYPFKGSKPLANTPGDTASNRKRRRYAAKMKRAARKRSEDAAAADEMVTLVEGDNLD